MMDSIFSRSKRGQVGFEAAWVVIVLVVVGIGLIFGLQVFNELNDDIQSESDLSAEAKTASSQTAGNAASTWDNVFLLFFILLWAFLAIMAYFSGANPVLMVITIIFAVVALVVALFLANVYADITSDETNVDFAGEFPKTNWILQHLLTLSIVVVFSVMLIMYGANQ